MAFQAIFFDLFNTLLHFNYSLLPEVEFNGEKLRTTTLEVYRKLEERFHLPFSYQRFLEEFLKSREMILKMMGEEHREFSSLERFRILCRGLGFDQDGAPESMVRVHMGEMYKMMYLRDETRSVLDRLQEFPLVLVSNFDHAPTARRALNRFGLERRFERVFISDEVGWRKPGEKFFEIVLKETRYGPDTCLYVGDDPCADVLGASRQGFQVAWLLETEPKDDPPVAPKWIIHDLEAILGIVGAKE